MMMNKTDGKCLNLVISKRKKMLSIEWHNHIQRKRTVSSLKCARFSTSFPGPHRKKYLNKMAAVLCALTVK